MPVSDFEAFRAELAALQRRLAEWPKKTLRDEGLRDRFRTLFRSWMSTVEASVAPHLKTQRDLLKLRAEIESLAQLSSKQKPIADYRKRLKRALHLADSLVIHLPPSGRTKQLHVAVGRSDLFLPEIPDLPFSIVPNSIVGWRRHIRAFVERHPFDSSVFIMIRYRKRNAKLIKLLKRTLKEQGLKAILASEHKLTDDLYNPVACLFCCARGVAVFDQPEPGETFNPNVAYELGILHLLGRPCLILKHNSLQTLQTDILMKIYEPYQTLAQLGMKVADWLEGEDSE